MCCAALRGVMHDEAEALNEKYVKFQREGRPFLTLKMAQTLDGRIATLTGDSQWISSPASLKLAHQLRAENDAVMVGAGTACFATMQSSLVLTSASDAMRGRAMGALMLAIGFGPLGAVLIGALASVWGAPLAVTVFAGSGMLLLACVVWKAAALWQPALKG